MQSDASSMTFLQQKFKMWFLTDIAQGQFTVHMFTFIAHTTCTMCNTHITHTTDTHLHVRMCTTHTGTKIVLQ